jgi:hypothetical protein
MQRAFLIFAAIFYFIQGCTQPARFSPETTTIYYKLGERVLPIQVMRYGTVKNIVCINLHDNEFTSVAAAQKVLQSHGGTLVRIENSNQRLIRFRYQDADHIFDPNRIFSRTGIEETLNDNGHSSPGAVREIEKLAARLLELTENADCIIALHNNADKGYSVKSYLPGNERSGDAKAVYAAPQQDADDIAFTTDSLLYAGMKNHGFNSIWQDNKNATEDGSLSVYCGKNNQRYINIETEHGKRGKYVKMLETLFKIIDNGE